VVGESSSLWLSGHRSLLGKMTVPYDPAIKGCEPIIVAAPSKSLESARVKNVCVFSGDDGKTMLSTVTAVRLCLAIQRLRRQQFGSNYYRDLRFYIFS